MSNELRSQKHYGALALLPLVVFLIIYVGVGLFFYNHRKRRSI